MIMAAKVTEKILPEGFYLDDLLIDNQVMMDFNYENYLRELINLSSWFMKKTGGEKFRKPESESHGENDAITEEYGIDFKRILGESALRSRHFAGTQMVRCTDGVVYEFKGKTRKPETLVKVHEALRHLDLAELKKIGARSRASADTELEKDIIAYLHVVSREKNLLLYYPAVFDVPDPGNMEDPEIVQTLADSVYQDYISSLTYRREIAPDYETYICLIYAGDLLILQYAVDHLFIVDRIPAMDSPTFHRIAGYYTDPEYDVMECFYK